MLDTKLANDIVAAVDAGFSDQGVFPVTAAIALFIADWCGVEKAAPDPLFISTLGIGF